MKDIVLLGGGGHARACLDVIWTQGVYHPTGILEKQASLGAAVLGVPIIGSDDDLPLLIKQGHCFLVAVGQIKTAETRMRLFRRVIELGGELPTIISPRSHISPSCQIGSGSIVMHSVSIGSGSIIGKNCIINTGAIVEHDSVVGDHCHISTGAIVNGYCQIGHRSFLGSGSVIKDYIKIGDKVVIGMGTRVHHNIENNQIVK